MAGPPCNPRHAVMMKKALVFALVAALCAACGPSSKEAEVPPAAGESPMTARGGSQGPSGRAFLRGNRASFAALADRGDLVAYPSPELAVEDGAYTWHRIELSEAHAFRSLETGSLRITSPSGEPLDFVYSRHVEHPSGDWTWVGRLKGGAASEEAVITFGERAVFGSIAEPGKAPLRLTTRRGSAWLVQTDPAKVATIKNEATRPSGPDYLVPPAQASSAAAQASAPQPAASAPSAATAVGAAAATTVDVVVGYTSGFAASLGGQSQAVTRLNNMVEIANQAYVNSQVDAAIRMVHALQVEYPDNTPNQGALETLTGYRSGAGQIPVDPAFSALRAARDQYGGDLVTLVRKFQTPENDGCGIAWLIGGGRTGLDAGDAPFGYSVVSDGVDTGTDGKSYFCRPETLAHELGHNMGSQHDRATATENGELKYGVFTYSFGQKTDSTAGNFYTVMAYGDAGQISYRVFSNPRITFCGGAPCGVAEQADNARSLAQTMPTVAMFRAATSTPPSENSLTFCDAGRFDFNGDTVADIFWRHQTDGWNAIWNSGLSGQERAITAVPSQLWQVGAVGDFNGDGASDVLWRHSTQGWNVVWRSANSQSTQELTSVASQVWRIVGVGDFNGDGRSDIFWRHMTDGWNHIWLGGNSGTPLDLSAVPAQVWRVAGIADFNGDGRADVLWRHAIDGWNVIWLSGSSSNTIAVSPMPASQWRIGAVGDFNGDTRADIIWRNSIDGRNQFWPSGQSAASVELTAVPSQVWEIVGAGDFTADGRHDLLWRHSVDGWNLLWPSANSQLARDLTPVPSQLWKITGMCRRDVFTLQ